MFSDGVDRRLKEQKKVVFCTARSTDKAKEGQIELEIIFKLASFSQTSIRASFKPSEQCSNDFKWTEEE